MDFELEYVRRRALEERHAARQASCPEMRERHIRLAVIFEAHALNARAAGFFAKSDTQ